MSCSFYTDTSCRGRIYSSSGRVTWLSSDWNDKFSSFRCNA
ncbi:hypothetical protein CKAH01_15109 [Colletotrichum kahawae]|uniref:Uncharacterized protein n=1 Tax=Colletotrichum kahawae TaxID=34407 RepID=A0AAD9YLT5_COLKA|nr:hypothetical protein CKAH01_15109 [Colletotrichum kahawae]